MRLVQALVPTGAREETVDVLQAEGIEFGLWEETSGRDYSDVLFVPAETDEVEAIINLLRESGVEQEGYIVVSDAEAVVTERLEAEASEGDSGHAVSRDELLAVATEDIRRWRIDLVFAVVSAVLATAGLLLDSATVIVGAMVIAPLLGPAIATSVGAVVGDGSLVRRGVYEQVGGLLVAVLSATLFAAAVRAIARPYLEFRTLSQLAEFSDPVALTLIIALAAGIAGALSLTSGVNTALIGVAAAAAVIPPAGAVGVGIAYGQSTVAVGAAVVVVTNLLSINFTSLATLWLTGYRPARWEGGSFERYARRLFTRQAAVLLLAVLLVSSVVVALTLNERANSRFEGEVRQLVREGDATVVSVKVEYGSGVLVREPQAVVVRIERAPPDFADALHRRIRARTGQNVRVVVFEATDVAGPPQSPSSRSLAIGSPHPSFAVGSSLLRFDHRRRGDATVADYSYASV